ncbi:MAG: DUF1801 domain-containing protein [Planctomycetaceae bacterium]
MQSKATTVAQYLTELPEDRRQTIETVRRVILNNLDSGFEEGMQYGMIGYYVPHRLYPAGYHCDPKQPLPFAALASQKNYMSLYIMSLYGEPKQEMQFREQWAISGKKLDMGKCCIRFRKLEDVALEAIAHAIGRVTAVGYVKACEAALQKKTTGPDTNSAKKSAKSGKGPNASQGAKSVAKNAARKKSAKKKS